MLGIQKKGFALESKIHGCVERRLVEAKLQGECILTRPAARGSNRFNGSNHKSASTVHKACLSSLPHARGTADPAFTIFSLHQECRLLPFEFERRRFDLAVVLREKDRKSTRLNSSHLGIS